MTQPRHNVNKQNKTNLVQSKESFEPPLGVPATIYRTLVINYHFFLAFTLFPLNLANTHARIEIYV